MSSPLAEGKSKGCPQCGGSFICCSGNCWCDGVAVPSAILSKLREVHDDCLCPACLGQAARSHAAIPRAEGTVANVFHPNKETSP